MSELLHMVSADNQKLGTLEVFTDRVEWEYTGPDPDGEIVDFLKKIENRDAFSWHEEVPGPTDTEKFNRMYLMESATILDNFDPIERVIVF